MIANCYVRKVDAAGCDSHESISRLALLRTSSSQLRLCSLHDVVLGMNTAASKIIISSRASILSSVHRYVLLRLLCHHTAEASLGPLSQLGQWGRVGGGDPGG